MFQFGKEDCTSIRKNVYSVILEFHEWAVGTLPQRIISLYDSIPRYMIMSEFPDTYAWIKLIDQDKGKAVPSGSILCHPSSVTIRFVVANNSNQPAGEIAVMGVIYKDDVKVVPHSLPITWIKTAGQNRPMEA